MGEVLHPRCKQGASFELGVATETAVYLESGGDEKVWAVMGRIDGSGCLMTASNADVIDLESRRRPKPPFAKLSKVLTEPDLPLKANERLVALVMFQYINLTTMQCWPSVDIIARRAKVSRNTVCRTIKTLQKIGLMEVTKKRAKGKFDRNIYDFTNVRKYCDRVSR